MAQPVHALVGIWTMDEALSDEQNRLIHREMMPIARAQPSFRSGYPIHDPETDEGHIALRLTGVAAPITARRERRQ